MSFFSKTYEKFKALLPSVNGFFISFFSLYLLFPSFSINKFDFSLYHHITIISFLSFFVLSLLISRFKISTSGVILSLLILLCSNYLNREYSLLQGPIIKGEIILFSFLSLILLILRQKKILYFLLLMAPLFLLLIFLLEAQKGMIWSDDNPTFLYRLSLLKEFFPNIPFYYTGWNAGLDARDFFATGALNIFFVSFPLVKFLDITRYFDIIHAYLLFVFLPLCIYISCKILKKDFQTSIIATALGISSSLFWYRWALKYGTLGFITSASLLLIVFSLSLKFLSKDEEFSPLEALLFIISVSLMLLWSLTGIVFVPIILYFLLFIKRCIKKKYFLRICLTIFLINIPVILIFLSVSKVGNFIAKKDLTSDSKIEIEDNNVSKIDKIISFYKAKEQKITTPSFNHNLKIFYKNIKDPLTATNSLIILFGLIGILYLPKNQRNIYILTSIWLVFLGSILSFFMPQLELNRMFIILGIILIIPSSIAIKKVIDSDFKLNIIQASLIFGLIFAGVFSTGKILKQRSLEVYKRQDENIINLISFLKEIDVEERILFTGFVLHDFSNGHIAPLPILTGKSLIASSPFHNVWRYTEVLPIEFLKTNDIESYLDLMNVKIVIAHERKWRNYFLENKDDYKLIYEFNNYKIFEYLNLKSSYILEGKASNIIINGNNIYLTPESKDIVLKFNYFDFLTSSNCEIEGFRASESINFIKLKNCNLNEETIIKSKNAINRVFLKNE